QRDAEAKLAEWQTQWDTYAKSSGEASKEAEVERTRLDYLDKQALETARRLETLQTEKRGADFDALTEQLAKLSAEHDTHKQSVESHTRLLDERRTVHEQVLETERANATALNEARTRLQALRGRLASLEALQHAALGQEKSAASEWLAKLGLDKSRRLGEVLQVEAGWETAVETVLGGLLEGVLAEAPHDHAGDLAGVHEADLALIATLEAGTAPTGTLAAQVRGPQAALAILSQVRVAQSLDEARRIAANMAAHESVITQAGEWLGTGYARVLRRGGAQAGMLAREREIQNLRGEIVQAQARVDQLAAEIDAIKLRKSEAEGARDDAQRELYTAHRRVAELAGQIQSHSGRIETARTRVVKIDEEIAALQARTQTDEAATREARARLEQAVARMGEEEQRRQHLDGERRRLLEAREEARMNAREAGEQAHQHALGIESKRTGVAALEQALLRMSSQFAQLEARKAEIAQQLESSQAPLAGIEAERQTYLNQRLLVDKQLVEARKGVEERDNEFRGYETERHRIEHVLSQHREAHAERRLTHQSLQMRAEQLQEAIAAAGHELQAVLDALPAGADPAEWQQQLEALDAKIKRLEPVNLAAISEFEEQSQRKTYLDAQLTDLNTALETLEGAIKKIDRETRQRFKETFDRVNTGLQELFPR
ncbi:MAG TPA: chromosome segregation protein SMC, partial [Rudaea sp.]|nr:chromosome segregation protein SMC [Rudaea sp.]